MLDLIELTLFIMSKPVPHKKHLGMALGRWVFGYQLRRPLILTHIFVSFCLHLGKEPLLFGSPYNMGHNDNDHITAMLPTLSLILMMIFWATREALLSF